MGSEVSGQTSRLRAQRIGTDDEDPMALFLQSIFAGLGQTSFSLKITT